MGWKLNWIPLLMIICLIDHSSPAVFFPFVYRDPLIGYKNSRSSSVHRGLLLSYSLPEKMKICRDLISQHYIDGETIISDDLKNEGDPQHSLIVGKIGHFVELYWPEDRMENLNFKCTGKNLAPGYKVDVEYLVSSTFQRGFMFNGADQFTSDDHIMELGMEGYIGLSPEFSSLKQDELERQYSAIRKTMETLLKESPKYMKLIEEKDDLSALSPWQTYLLCSSIILSPTHEKDRQRFPLDWIDYTKNIKKGIHKYQKEELKFKIDNTEEKWSADCLYCVPSTQAAHDFSTFETNLLLTRPYDDKHSLYILIKEDGIIRFKEYLENVPILINPDLPLTNDPEHIPKFLLE